MKDFDTIAAISTPIGVGGISVIRVSGENSIKITDKIFKSKNKKPLQETETHKIVFGHIYDDDGIIIDEVLISVMLAPRTFTGENTIEISCHGGISVTKMILKQVIKNGARLATNGEFTKRAFLNGKLDLSQAEAVIDIIHSDSELSVYASESQLFGSLKNEIDKLRNSLLDCVANVIAVIDYPEEDIDDLTVSNIIDLLKSNNDKVKYFMSTYQTGKIIKEGAKVVIAGRPNVGKSSLLNALLKENRAIVTDIAGTTRDILEERLEIDGLAVRIIDTAGIRNSSDTIEAIGIDKAKENINDADLILFVLDYSDELTNDDLKLIDEIKDKNAFVIINKDDLDKKLDINKVKNLLGDKIFFSISAKNSSGINEIALEIKNSVLSGQTNVKTNLYLTNERHFEILNNASLFINNAINSLESGIFPDIVTIDIENAISSLGEITGMTVSEEIIGKIFANFCLGK